MFSCAWLFRQPVCISLWADSLWRRHSSSTRSQEVNWSRSMRLLCRVKRKVLPLLSRGKLIQINYSLFMITNMSLVLDGWTILNFVMAHTRVIWQMIGKKRLLVPLYWNRKILKWWTTWKKKVISPLKARFHLVSLVLFSTSCLCILQIWLLLVRSPNKSCGPITSETRNCFEESN